MLEQRRKIAERLENREPVLFKRPPYSARGNYSTKPLWHRLEKVTVTETYEHSNAVAREDWQALCGYTYEVQPWLFGMPEVRVEVRTAKLRCTKCDVAFAGKVG